MPIFAQLDHEDEVQLADRTRIDSFKSYNTLNQQAFSKLYIKPSLDEVQYSVYNSNINLRYLDWEYRSWKIDIDSSNNKLDFSEVSGVELTATLTAGSYSLSALATEIQTQLNSAGALTYTVSVDINDKMTISATGGFSLLISSGSNKYLSILKELYLGSKDLTGAATYTSARIEALKRKITVYVGEDRQQIDTIICAADVAGSLNSKYFFLYASGDILKFYVWFNVSAGGVDPAIAGATGIQVAISTNDPASTVATAVASAIDLNANFSASANTSTVTITHASYDWNTAPTNGNLTGFTFSTSTQGEAQDSESSYIKVYSELGDHLFSNDQELYQYEPDIRKWMVAGRNTFLNIHRQAQKTILEWLDKNGYQNIYKEKFKKNDLVDISEVNEWSRFIALRIIFEGIKNSADDVWQQKRTTYEAKEVDARQRAILRIDTDKSGDLYLDEGVDPYSMKVAFR